MSQTKHDGELAGRLDDSHSAAKQIGQLFRELRGAAKMAPPQLAAQLQTNDATLQVLERGVLDRFPPWSEIERLARGYASIIGLDPHPLLLKLSSLLYGPVAQQHYVEKAPKFAAKFRAGQQVAEHDARTQVGQITPGPREQFDPRTGRPQGPDPKVPENPLAETPFDPNNPSATAMQANAPYTPPPIAEHMQANQPQGLPPIQKETTYLKGMMFSVMLLAIIGMVVNAFWTELQHLLSFATDNETSMDNLRRYLKALRELIR